MNPDKRKTGRDRLRHPRRVRVQTETGEVAATAIERNGNLTLVDYDDGGCDWLAPFEIEED